MADLLGQNNRRAATLHDGTLPRVQRAVSKTVNRANDESVVAALTQSTRKANACLRIPERADVRRCEG